MLISNQRENDSQIFQREKQNIPQQKSSSAYENGENQMLLKSVSVHTFMRNAGNKSENNSRTIADKEPNVL